jgi:hypothetical protein
MPSRDSPMLWPTGTGAVRAHHASERLTMRAWRKYSLISRSTRCPRIGPRVAEHVGRAFLQLVAEHVLVALRFQVQQRSDLERKSSASSKRPGSAGPRRSSSGSVSLAIVIVAKRSRSAPGASFTSGSSW